MPTRALTALASFGILTATAVHSARYRPDRPLGGDAAIRGDSRRRAIFEARSSRPEGFRVHRFVSVVSARRNDERRCPATALRVCHGSPRRALRRAHTKEKPSAPRRLRNPAWIESQHHGREASRSLRSVATIHTFEPRSFHQQFSSAPPPGAAYPFPATRCARRLSTPRDSMSTKSIARRRAIHRPGPSTSKARCRATRSSCISSASVPIAIPHASIRMSCWSAHSSLRTCTVSNSSTDGMARGSWIARTAPHD